MWEYNYELYHYGILGQKWGVRRYQNPDGSLTPEGRERYGSIGLEKKVTYNQYRTDYANRFSKEEKRHKNTKKIVQLNQKNARLLNKYDFNRDDGGGGSTSADRKAGAKYWRNTEEIYALDKQRTDEVSKIVKDQLLEKYGSQRMKSFKRTENIKAVATVAEVLAVVATWPVSVPIMIAYSMGKSALADKKSVKKKRSSKRR